MQTTVNRLPKDNKPAKAEIENKPVESDSTANSILVYSKCPKHNFPHKVHHLWGSCFRINFYNPDNANYIEHSYFAEVLSDNKIKYTWSIRVNELETKTLSEVKG